MPIRQKGSFVGSETSRAEVVVYPNHPSEFDVVRTKLEFKTIPVQEKSTTAEHLISVSTAKQLGAVAASFEVQIKSDRDLRLHIQDGDWIDITFTRHNEKHHTLRGIVMTIQQTLSATSGPTIATYTLIGAEFSLIFDEQQFWFDQVTQGDYFNWVASRIYSQDSNFANGRPDVTVALLLRSFLQPANNAGAAFWVVPKDLPTPISLDSGASDQSAERNFADLFTFVDGYTHTPPRTSAIIPSQFTATASSVWALAKEFADEMICEFFTDLVYVTDLKLGVPGDVTSNGAQPVPNSVVIGNAYINRPVVPGETHMAVIFRDAPFPNTVRDKDSLLSAPYFTLPMVEVEPQHVVESTLARHGVTRKNTFFFGGSLRQDTIATYYDFQLPLVDIESIKHHGIRRMDAESRYITDYDVADPTYAAVREGAEDQESSEEPSGDGTRTLAEDPLQTKLVEDARTGQPDAWLQMAYDYRNIVRDLHCMNHLLQTGTISLNHGRPDIRIGTRFRILGAGPEQDFTGYVESVQHNWSYETGLRTTLSISHGWTGTDQSYVNKLRECVKRYKVFEPTYTDETDASAADDEGAKTLQQFETGLITGAVETDKAFLYQRKTKLRPGQVFDPDTGQTYEQVPPAEESARPNVIIVPSSATQNQRQ
jgi:hypothetical protein